VYQQLYTEEGFASQYIKDGKLAGMDAPSGGYPYPTMDIQNVKVWETREEAQKYVASFKELRVVQVQISLIAQSDNSADL